MSHPDRNKPRIKLPRPGLTLQLLVILILPLAILLVAITFGSIAIHQNAMRTMIGERDERAVRTAASALGEQINFSASELTGLAVLLSSSSADTIADKLPLPPISCRISTAVWPSLTQWQAVGNPGGPINLDGLDQRGTSGLESDFLPIGRPGWQAHDYPPSDRWQPPWYTVGHFGRRQLDRGRRFPSPHLPSTPWPIRSRTESQLTVVLLDQDRQVLYQTGGCRGHTVDHPGIAEALQGQSGTVYVQVGNDEHVTAYSPVATTGWALITEESWEAVSTPTLRTTPNRAAGVRTGIADHGRGIMVRGAPGGPAVKGA